MEQLEKVTLQYIRDGRCLKFSFPTLEVALKLRDEVDPQELPVIKVQEIGETEPYLYIDGDLSDLIDTTLSIADQYVASYGKQQIKKCQQSIERDCIIPRLKEKGHTVLNITTAKINADGRKERIFSLLTPEKKFRMYSLY